MANLMNQACVTPIAMCLCVGLSAALDAKGQERIVSYEVTSLGAINPTDMNDHLEIIGARGDPSVPLIWENGIIAELPDLSGEDGAVPRAINNLGVIIGNTGWETPVRWDDGVISIIEELSGDDALSASGINDAGTIAGTYWDYTGQWSNEAVKWVEGVRISLHDPQWDYSTSALDVNSEGTIVGIVYGQPLQGIVWSADGTSALLDVFNQGDAPITALNDAGHMAGVTTNAEGLREAYVIRSGEYNTLQIAEPGKSIRVFDIDHSGRRVFGTYDGEAVMWEDGVMLLLEPMTDGAANFPLYGALLTNRDGFIVCQEFDGFFGSSVLLTPVISLIPNGDPIAGEIASLTIRNAAAEGEVRLYQSTSGPGETEVPDLGVTLDLENAELIWSGPADEIGLASASREIDIRSSDRNAWFQAAREGDTTNTVELTVRPKPFDLSLAPLIAGEPAVATVTSARPNEPVHILISKQGEGHTRVAPLSLSVNLLNPILFTSGMTDAEGSAVLVEELGFANRGEVIWVQAAQIGALSDLRIVQIN